MFVNLTEAVLHSTSYVHEIDSRKRQNNDRSTSKNNNNNINLDNPKRKNAVDNMDENHSETFISAEAFIESLYNEGSQISCDETSSSFNRTMQLPPYYNKELFKRGQDFFYKNIFGLFLSKLLGLISQLALPTLKILMMTNMSDTPMKAYRRYMATIFHMCVWYSFNPDPESKLWRSICKVKSMHNSASSKSNKVFKMRITQKDMALTQFGFMGLALVRSKMMGIHYATEEEWKAFTHLWRVVGYLMGIEDKFNICRESVNETRQICDLLIQREFIPAMENIDDDFDRMSKALIDGMWAMNPLLQYNAFVYYLYMCLDNSNDTKKVRGKLQMDERSRKRLNVIVFTISALEYKIVRWILNWVQIVSLWLMRTFPFLAYYMYGKQKAQVNID